MLSRYGLMYDQYRDDQYLWEAVMILQKATLLSVFLLGSAFFPSTTGQASSGKKPFKATWHHDKSDNLSNGCSCLWARSSWALHLLFNAGASHLGTSVTQSCH
jgi:hypothetical protein